MAETQNTNIKAKGDASSYTEALNKMIEVNKELEASFKNIIKSVSPMNDAFDSAIKKAKESEESISETLKNININSESKINPDDNKFEKSMEKLIDRREKALERATEKLKNQMDVYNKQLENFEKNKDKDKELNEPIKPQIDISEVDKIDKKIDSLRSRYASSQIKASDAAARAMMAEAKIKEKATIAEIELEKKLKEEQLKNQRLREERARQTSNNLKNTVFDILGKTTGYAISGFTGSLALGKMSGNLVRKLGKGINGGVSSIDFVSLLKTFGKNKDNGKEATDTGKEAADAGKEAADTGKEAADAGKEAAKVGKKAADAGKEAAKAGKEAAEAGKAAAEAADATAEATKKIGEAGEAAGKGAAAAAEAVGPAGAAIAAVAAAVVLLVAAIVKMNKAGKSGLDTTKSMTKAYKELGDGADYALAYAERLNKTLGQNLDVTLEKISRVATEMRSLGMNTLQSTNVAVTTEGLSQNIAAAWGIDDVDKVREQFLDALNGGSGLEYTGAFTSDAVMAAWLAQTKGINMYSVAISDAQMEAYRLEKIIQDLGKVTLSTGETLTNMNIDLDSTWARNQQIAGQLEETRKKWEALMVPVYKLGIAIKSWIVDTLFKASNILLKLLGQEELKLSDDVLVNKTSLNSVYDLNAAYSQTGEKIKAAKAQLLSFDELVSLNTVQTLNPSESLDIANNSQLTGLGFSVEDAMKNGIDNADDLRRIIESMDIQLASSGKKLKEIWGDMSEIQKHNKWIDFAIRFSQLGEDLPEWLKDYNDGKEYETWMHINALLESGDKESLVNLLENLNSNGDHRFDAIIDTAIKAVDTGYQGSLDNLLKQKELDRTVNLGIKIIGSWITGTVLGAILFGHVGAVVGGFIALAINQEEIKQVWSNLVEDFKKKFKEAWHNLLDFTTPDYEYSSGRDGSKGGGHRRMASGGIALRPMVAEIAEGGYPELVQPLGGPVAQQFYDNIADAVRSVGAASGNPTSINVTIPVSNMFATNYELKQLSDIMADYLAEALRNRGALDSGVII